MNIFMNDQRWNIDITNYSDEMYETKEENVSWKHNL